MAEIRMNKSRSDISSQKYLMKSSYNTLQTSIQHFDKLVYEYENEPSKHKAVNPREMTKRIAKINNFKS